MVTSISERLRLHKEAGGTLRDAKPKTPIMDSHAWSLSHDKPYLLSPSSQKYSRAVRRYATERSFLGPGSCTPGRGSGGNHAGCAPSYFNINDVFSVHLPFFCPSFAVTILLASGTSFYT